jgi:hypothetical protein
MITSVWAKAESGSQPSLCHESDVQLLQYVLPEACCGLNKDSVTSNRYLQNNVLFLERYDTNEKQEMQILQNFVQLQIIQCTDEFIHAAWTTCDFIMYFN